MLNKKTKSGNKKPQKTIQGSEHLNAVDKTPDITKKELTIKSYFENCILSYNCKDDCSMEAYLAHCENQSKIEPIINPLQTNIQNNVLIDRAIENTIRAIEDATTPLDFVEENNKPNYYDVVTETDDVEVHVL